MRPIRILLLRADPSAARRDLEREARELRRARVELTVEGATTPSSLRAALARHRPDVVHFTGLGGAGGVGPILLEDDGQSVPVEARWLADLVTSAGTVRCVVLDACGSYVQAEALGGSVDCVIALAADRGDGWALGLMTTFYRRLGRGDSVSRAFALAQGVPDGGPPAVRMPLASLTTRPGVSADEIMLDLAEPFRKAWWILVAVAVVVLGIVGYGGYRLVRAVWGESDAAAPGGAARVGD